MYTVIKRMEISASHCLKLSYESKCENLHGHNWIITVYCQAEQLNEDGMVVDFTHIKEGLPALPPPLKSVPALHRIYNRPICLLHPCTPEKRPFRTGCSINHCQKVLFRIFRTSYKFLPGNFTSYFQ